MAEERRISETPQINAVSSSGSDRLVVLANTTGNAAVKTLAVSGLFLQNTPANSAVTRIQGTITYDTSYLYVTVANNVTKRAALSSF